MADAPHQRKSRADATLDDRVVADLPFFTGRNRTKKHKAAILLAEDELTDRQIAEKLKMARSVLSEWKLNPDFAAVQKMYEDEIIAEALQLPIAKKTERLRGLNDLVTRYWQVIEQRGKTYSLRAESPEEAALNVFGTSTPPWAASGMYVEQPKIAANGKTVTEWAFDKALDSAIKDAYREAAAETGQRTEKHEHTGPEGAPLTVILTEREDGPR